MRACSLDTMVLIYAMKRPPADAPAPALDCWRRTVVLLDKLRDERARVVLSTVAVSEVLAGIRQERERAVLAAFNSRFEIKPVDQACACLAADLWRMNRDLSKPLQVDRRVLKVDVYVVAAAKVAGATHFYSHDEKCRTLAGQAGLIALDLPTHSPDLYRDAEIRRGEGGTGLEA